MPLIQKPLVVVRGAGDLATGVILRLARAGFRVAALEAARPSAIRRTVCLSEAMYEGDAEVEGLRARRVGSLEELRQVLETANAVPLLEDPTAASLPFLQPVALVDAIIAKRNLGTRRGMAPVVVALGPGFEASVDADAVIETNRGHDLGRVLLAGSAEPDTGVPGLIAGRSHERVIHAPAAGVVENLRRIGDTVRAGEPVLALVDEGRRVEVPTTIDGILRGLIRPGYRAPAGLKVADVDPRCVREHCFTVSDKANAIAGGVLEAILRLAP